MTERSWLALPGGLAGGGGRWRGRGRPRGQGVVEFALIAPLLFLVLFVIFDGCYYFYTSAALAEAAREGARLAIVHGATATTGVYDVSGSCGASCSLASCNDTTGICARIRQAIPITDPSQVTVSITPVSGTAVSPNGNRACTGGSTSNLCNYVDIKLTSKYNPFTPLSGGFLFGAYLNLQAESRLSIFPQ